MEGLTPASTEMDTRRTVHPEWKPGDKQRLPFQGGYQTLDPTEAGGATAYPLVISSVVPRPIAFVSTVSTSGIRNLSPYSYFGAMGHDPPVVSIGCCRSAVRGGGHKDTAANILETGEFVVNIVSAWFVEAANHTCGNYDPEVDEFSVAGLTPLASDTVAPPRVAESALHMECRLLHHYEVKNAQGVPTTSILLGEVKRFHVHEGVAARSPTGKLIVDPTLLQPVSRLGGNTCDPVPCVCCNRICVHNTYYMKAPPIARNTPMLTSDPPGCGH